MNKKLLTIIVSLLTIVQTIEAFTGNGTETSPYLIQAVADWEQLASDVSGGNAYQGSFFRLTADISVKTCVGSEEHAFSGTFDGANHTLTLNIGDAVNYVDKPIAPFVSLSGATIQHLKTAGTLYISHRFAAGVASYIRGLALSVGSAWADDFPVGDVNHDMKVDINDVVCIVNYMAGQDLTTAADVNNDEHVDINDVVFVINIMAGRVPDINNGDVDEEKPGWEPAQAPKRKGKVKGER